MNNRSFLSNNRLPIGFIF